jgi:carbamate kinase
MVEVPRRGWRRVVPSPAPVAIVQIEVIEMLARQGITVICCGGGGIPITRNPDGRIVGHEAVIDKDRSSMLLAVALGARRFVITTEVDRVYRGYLSDHPVPLPELTSAEAAELADAGEFPAGSMGPKIEAAIRYLENIDGEVIICSPIHIVAALAGESGTRITREGRKSS